MEVLEMGKTPEYTKRAAKKYRDKFDILQVRLDKGTKERIQAITSASCSEYVKRLIMDDLEQKENGNAKEFPTGIFCGRYKIARFKSVEDAEKEIDNIKHDILAGKYDDFLEITEEQRERKAQSLEILSICKR